MQYESIVGPPKRTRGQAKVIPPTKEMVNAAIQSSERLEGIASLLAMLKDRASSEQITASELSAVRCIVKACASDLVRSWNGPR